MDIIPYNKVIEYESGSKGFFMSLFYRRLWSRQLQRLQIDSAQLALGMLNYQLNESSHLSMALFHRSANQKFGRDSYSIQQ